MTDEHTQAVETEAPEASLWPRIKLSVGILALALLLLFMAQNLQRVNIHFLWFDWHTRLLWALLVAAAHREGIRVVPVPGPSAALAEGVAVTPPNRLGRVRPVLGRSPSIVPPPPAGSGHGG